MTGPIDFSIAQNIPNQKGFSLTEWNAPRNTILVNREIESRNGFLNVYIKEPTKTTR